MNATAPLQRCLLLFACVIAPAAALDRSLFMPRPLPYRFGAEAGGAMIERSRVRDQDGSLRLSETELRLHAPIGAGQPHQVTVGLALDHLVADGRAQFPATAELPDHFTRLTGSLSWKRMLAGSRSLTISGDFGSASDEPFDSDDELLYGLAAVAVLPASGPAPGRTAWLVGAVWRNDLEALDGWPIPLVVYSTRIGKTLGLKLGMPMAYATWQPRESVILAGGWRYGAFGLRAEYRPQRWLGLGLRLRRNGFSAFRAARTDEDLRISYSDYEAAAYSGVTLGPGRQARLAVGWRFDREFTEERIDPWWEDNDDNAIEIDGGWFASMRVEWTFGLRTRRGARGGRGRPPRAPAGTDTPKPVAPGTAPEPEG